MNETRNNGTGYYGASPSVHMFSNTSVSNGDYFQACDLAPPTNAAGFFGTPPSAGGTTFNRMGITPPNNARGFFGTPPSSNTMPGAHDQQFDSHAFTQFQTWSALLEEQNAKISELMNENKQLVSSFNVELQKVKEDFAMFKDGSTSKIKKSAKLPKSLMLAVKRLHEKSENQFDGSKLFNDDLNQMVASTLEHQLEEEFDDEYPKFIIHRAVSRHFESRRRIHNDSQLSRISIKEKNDKKTKIKNRQRQLYSRRLRLCKTPEERKLFREVDENFMTEETDNSDGGTFHQHKPNWRSRKLNKILTILDKRERAAGRKYVKKHRVLSSPSESAVPPDAPSWAIIEDSNEDDAVPPLGPAEMSDVSSTNSPNSMLNNEGTGSIDASQGDRNEEGSTHHTVPASGSSRSAGLASNLPKTTNTSISRSGCAASVGNQRQVLKPDKRMALHSSAVNNVRRPHSTPVNNNQENTPCRQKAVNLVSKVFSSDSESET